MCSELIDSHNPSQGFTYSWPNFVTGRGNSIAITRNQYLFLNIFLEICFLVHTYKTEGVKTEFHKVLGVLILYTCYIILIF